MPATRRAGQGDARAARRWRRELNNIVNELAYKPPHGQSYLFYLPWASHDTNSVLASQDAIGPLRRSLILFSCGSLQLLQDLAKPNHNPTLATLIQLLDTPDLNAHCTHRGRRSDQDAPQRTPDSPR